MGFCLSSCATVFVPVVITYYAYITLISKAQYTGNSERRGARCNIVQTKSTEFVNGRLILDVEGMALRKAKEAAKLQKAEEGGDCADNNNNNNNTDDKKATFLDSSKHYVFGLSPHHVMSWHHQLVFSNGAGFMDKVYSGPKRSAAASVVFLIPIIREYFLSIGCVDAGRPTFDRMLSKGNSMVVLPGGIAEQVRSEYGHERVLLRKGFIKIAMEHNVEIVPCYGFGESFLYNTSNFMKNFRIWVAERFSVGLPLMWGRWWWCPLVPNRNVNVAVVIGAPIDPKAIVAEAVADGRLTQEAADDAFKRPQKGAKAKKAAAVDGLTPVDVVFEHYVKELTRLFETYKVEAGYPNAKLELL